MCRFRIVTFRLCSACAVDSISQSVQHSSYWPMFQTHWVRLPLVGGTSKTVWFSLEHWIIRTWFIFVSLDGNPGRARILERQATYIPPPNPPPQKVWGNWKVASSILVWLGWEGRRQEQLWESSVRKCKTFVSQCRTLLWNWTKKTKPLFSCPKEVLATRNLDRVVFAIVWILIAQLYKHNYHPVWYNWSIWEVTSVREKAPPFQFFKP